MEEISCTDSQDKPVTLSSIAKQFYHLYRPYFGLNPKKSQTDTVAIGYHSGKYFISFRFSLCKCVDVIIDGITDGLWGDLHKIFLRRCTMHRCHCKLWIADGC